MFNIVVKKYGGPETLIYEEKKTSKLEPNTIRIKVKSIGVNFADTLIIRGKYQERPRPPFSPGLEASGIVTEIDKTEKKFKVGDKVMAIMKYGAYQTEVVVPQENTYYVPQGMQLLHAGGFPVVYGTAYSAIVIKGKLKQNEICVILGATGGVGMAAIEIAKAYKATVIACGGSDQKLSECLKKGADYALNYNGKIIRQELKKLGINEVDVVIDMVGGQSSLDLVKALKWNGRLIIVGFTSGNIPEIPANRLLLKNAKAEGLYWGEHAYRNPKEIGKDFEALEKLYIEKKLSPSINRIFDLKDANLALNELANRNNIGKIILKC